MNQEQIRQFRLRARKKGFSEAQISAEIARKQQEMARVNVKRQPNKQPTATIPTTPVKEKRSLGGLIKNAGQDIVDFAVNTPIQTAKSIMGVGFEGARILDRTINKNKMTGSTLERGLQENPFVKPEELPGSQKELFGGILKNVGRTVGLEQDETGKIVFNLDTLIQSAYEKPVTTALVAKDIAGGLIKKAPAKVTKAGLLEKQGTNLRRGVLNPQAKASPFMSEEMSALQKVQTKLGLKGSAQAQLEQLPDLFRKSQKEIKTLLKKSKTTKKGALSDEFLKQIDDANYNLDDIQFSKAVESEMNTLSKLDGASPLKQYQALEKYRNLLKSTRKKIDKGTTLLPKEEARLAAFNSLKASIDTVSLEVRALNTLENQMYNISEGLAKSTKKKGFGVGPVKLPGEISQSLQDKAGRLLQGSGKFGQTITSKIPKVGIPKGTGLGMATSGALQVKNLNENISQPSENIEADTNGEISDNNVDEYSQVGESIAHPVFGNMTKQKVLEDAFKSGMNSKQLDEIEKIYDRFAPEGEGQVKLSDAAIKNITDVRGAIRDIGNLRDEIKSTDLVGPIKGLAAKYPYAISSKELQAIIDRVRQNVGKALEGGVLRKEDEEKYKRILPVITDPKEVALRKLDELEKTMKSNVDDYVYMQKMYGKGSEGTTANDLLGL